MEKAAIVAVPLTKNSWLLKISAMKANDRDLLVLLKDEFMSPSAIEHEVEQLNAILLDTENPAQLCQAHELVLWDA